MLLKCKKKHHIENANYVVGFSENLPFPSNSFNKIVAYDSLHHWQDQIKGLKECLRVLTDDGALYLVEVDPNDFWGNLVTKFERMLGMNSKFYSPPDLTKLVKKKIGFKAVRYSPLNGSLAYTLICYKNSFSN